jgi:toxin CptA
MTSLLILAALAVGAMGFAIQRGGTCTVAAIDELLTSRRIHRLAAMLEASLWVAGGLAIAQLLHLAGSMPAGFAIDRWTVIGGVLLGLGAWLNGACVFGAIARLGSGEWAYLLTPIGFYVGCLSVMPLFSRPAAAPTAGSPLLMAAAVLAPLFVLFALWRTLPALIQVFRTSRIRLLQMKVWAPHAATIVIGVTFVITLLAAGRWAYTDVLADLAAGMAGNVGLGVLLLIALFVGALLGGWTAGRWNNVAPSAPQLMRCFAGGVLMGWGSLLIPGSNDGLILIGIPLLYPYAWLAFATMCATIAAALAAQRVWRARLAAVAAGRPTPGA